MQTAPQVAEPLLVAAEAEKVFGGVVAVDRVSFTLYPGQIMAIIGPNGAGKTTVFNLISCVMRPSSGDIRFKGRSLRGVKPCAVAGLGIARTFQNVRIFGNMSVIENVVVGRQGCDRMRVLGPALSLPSERREERRVWAESQAHLEMVGLAEYGDEQASSLSLGQQRMLEFARAMAIGPQLLLLDEPGAGLSAAERGELVDLIYRVREAGVTVMLVEHDMNLVMGVADWVVVLDYGEKIAEGTPAQVRSDERVIAAYLGNELE
jgi:ABC-type branched-subunit amino acid transport system ATPase component